MAVLEVMSSCGFISNNKLLQAPDDAVIMCRMEAAAFMCCEEKPHKPELNKR